MNEEPQSGNKNLGWVWLLVVGGLIWWAVSSGGFGFFQSNDWTLMVCETKMENGVECYDNSYEIPGFKSANECMLAGASQFENEGFECGRNCRYEEFSTKVCSEICNKAGCSN